MSYLKHIKNFLIFATISLSLQSYGGKVFTGIAVPLVVENISSGSDASYYGTVRYIANKGDLIQPRITDLSGKTVSPGTIVMKQGTKYWKAILDADIANIATSKQDLLTATENLKRYKELAPSGAESIQNYQQFQNAYYKYFGAYIQTQGNFLLDAEVLDSRTQYAPFEGYVSDVMYTIGRASGNPQTVEITQLNPIGIKVEMDRKGASKITPATPITIYIPETGTKQGVYNGFSILCDEGIIFITENYPKKLTASAMKSVKYEVKSCFPVDYFYINFSTNKELSVPRNAILKDSKGYFVWKAQNRKYLVPGESLNPVFQVEKAYITPGNLQRLFAGRVHFRILTKSGNLAFGDVVLTDTPKDLKNNDTVAFMPRKYIIMPGDGVKVEIDN